MATKAEKFRYEVERSKTPKLKPKPRRPPKRIETTGEGTQNLSAHAGKKALVATEESHSGKRSRKASRTSAHHGKNSTVLEYVARMKNESPQVRHGRR